LVWVYRDRDSTTLGTEGNQPFISAENGSYTNKWVLIAWRRFEVYKTAKKENTQGFNWRNIGRRQ
jgi:hypothetical protein